MKTKRIVLFSIVLLLSSCKWLQVTNQTDSDLSSDTSALTADNGQGGGSASCGLAEDSGKTCCSRSVAFVPVSLPENQRDVSSFLAASFWAGRQLWCDNCPLRVEWYGYTQTKTIEKIINEWGKGMGVQPDSAYEACLEEACSLDYLFIGNLIANNVTGIDENGDVIGDLTINVTLMDNHHAEDVKTSSISWHGDSFPEGFKKMNQLSNDFAPLDVLIYDYERLPESVEVNPEQEPIGNNEEMTIQLTNFQDSKGRQPHEWWRVFVEVDQGRILNGMTKGPYKVFDVGNGNIELEYRSPTNCPCDNKTETVHIYNTCHKADIYYGMGLVEQEIATETFEIVCDKFELEFANALHQSVPGALQQDIFYDSTVSVKIDFQTDPPQLNGEGDLTITGSGVAGECHLTHGGGGTITITGTLEEREDQPPLLKIRADIIIDKHGVTSPDCEDAGGGLIMPISLPEYEFELSYLDGEVYKWEYTQPSVSGDSGWTLDLPCP